MRVLCCGDRNWKSFDIIQRELEKFRELLFDEDIIIIEGVAKVLTAYLVG